ncbi:MAG TPA: pilus assembly protein CpaE [Acidimicrobiia bacterium]|nr:pilus assembly protein CpaE [Acidimicrobiia bacterium]
MISVVLARQLRSAGLTWRPRQFDFFHIPDRDLDDRVFVIADLSVEVQPLADGIAAITFNGAVEWSLDYILQQDVVWMPTEAQIRSALGKRITALQRTDTGWCCVLDSAGGETRHHGPTAPDAYGRALLSVLSHGAVNGG